MKLEFSAGGLIYKRQKGLIYFALILDQYGNWTFPKGHIEKKEKPEEAAAREVSEEIGIQNLTNRSLLTKIDYWFKFEDNLIHKFVYYYLMEAPEDAELKPQLEELEDAQWFLPEEMIKKLGYKKDSLDLVRLAFKNLEINIPVEDIDEKA